MPKKNRGYWLEWREERNVWEIQWYERGKRKRKSTGTTNRAEADRQLKEHIQVAERRSYSRLVDDILNDYAVEHAPHVSKPEDILRCIINLSPFFGPLTPDEVTKSTCQQYATQKTPRRPGKEKLSTGTIRKDLEVLRAAFNHDYKEGRIDKVPYIWMPQKPESRQRWLTRDEAAALLWHARKGPFYLQWFIVLSLYSGQRKQAVLNLTWDRVDLKHGKINWQYGQRTNKRRPLQPMPDEIRMFLRLLSRYGTRGFVLNNDGKKIGDIKKSLSTALKRAKIKGASSHTLKHTGITWMMQNGTDIWAIAGFTGTSVQTLTNTYGHHAPEYLEAARTSHKQARARRRLPR